jgi:hypothetical protein
MKLITLLLLIFASKADAQDTRTFFSPGIKFGYQWDSGMFAGLELSYTLMPGRGYGTTLGATFNIDLLRSGGYKVHLGVQGGSIIGGEIGPTYAKEKNGQAEWGYSASVFGLAGLMPYYTYTNLFSRRIHEAGLLIKLPVQLAGPDLGSIFKT